MTQQAPRKFRIGDTVIVRTGFYAGVTTKVTGCFVDKIHGGIPYVTVDFCQVPFYEDALAPAPPAESTETDKCEVCEKTDGPFIRVEVSEDGEHYSWLNVCSEDCLHQVTLRWKQTAEVIRPGE